MPSAKPLNKPDRPYEDYPLFAHRNGQWCRTIRGKQHYFGVWSDWEGALKLYQEQKDDLFAGRKVSTGEGTTLAVVVRPLVGGVTLCLAMPPTWWKPEASCCAQGRWT